MADQGRVFGRYRVDGLIGEGGMGDVYLATDQALGRQVALKVLPGHLAADPVFRARFEREAHALARLSSPHVTSIYDVGEHEGSLYLATQYVAGGDLVDLLAAGGPMSPVDALRLCAQVCDALADAHAVGVVHRDVKPGNVLIEQGADGRPEVVLCDFGICQTDATSGLTVVGYVAGSWEYLAPERLGGAPASAASDLYSVGCLLWACVAGAPPYVGTDDQIADAHAFAPVPSLPSSGQFGADQFWAEQFNRVLARLMAKHPARRHATATIARDDLLYAARHSGSGTSTATRAPAGVEAGDNSAGVGAGAGLSVPGGGGLEAPPPPAPPAPALGSPASRPRGPRRWLLPAAGVAAAALVAATVVAVGGIGSGDGSPAARSDSPLTRAGQTASPGDATPGDPSDDSTTSAGEGGDPPSGPVVLVSDGDRLVGLALRDGGLVETGEVGAGSGADRQLVVDGVAWDVGLDGRRVVVQRPTGAVSMLRLPVDAVDVQAGDVTGDGRADLVIAGTEGIYVAADAGRRLRQPDRWLGPWVSADEVAVGDFDGDGVDDLAWWSAATLRPELTLLRSTGDSFEEQTGLDRVALARAGRLDTTGLVAADLDGDGQAEVAAVGRGTPITLVDPDGFEGDPRIASTGPTGDPLPWQITAGDLDDDDTAELIAQRPADGGAELALVGDDGEPGSWTGVDCQTECVPVGVIE